MQQIEQLIRSAVGFNQDRGDQISVINVRFPTAETTGGVEAASPLMGFDKNDIMRAVELAVLAIVAILMIFFVARPLLGAGGGKRGKNGAPAMIAPAQIQRVMVAADGQQMQIAGDNQLALAGPTSADDPNHRIDMARVDGQVRASAVKKVSEFVERHPDESVAILRSWLHETT